MRLGWLLLGTIFFCFSFSSENSHAIAKSLSLDTEHEKLNSLFLNEKTNAKYLRAQTLGLGNKSVPVLVKVMKEGAYPDDNRWVATFLLAQLMGIKSAPFLVKFLGHPNWMMRLASLRSLLFLKQNQYEKNYTKLLKDPSLLVRKQAIENIEKLKIKNAGRAVLGLMKENQILSQRDPIILEQAIRTLASLKYQPAQDDLVLAMEDKSYQEYYPSLNYALESLTGRKSPPGSWEKKRVYWRQSTSIHSSLK